MVACRGVRWSAPCHVCLTYFDVILGPPTGLMRLILWPVDLLLWATTSDTPLPTGKFEWNPVQDFAVCVGSGASWAFWVIIGWMFWSRRATNMP